MQHAIDKKCRRGANTRLDSAAQVLLHTLQVYMVCHLIVVALQVELRPFCVLTEALRFQVPLILEQQIVHLPELMLSCRRFRRLGGELTCGCTSRCGKWRNARRT